MVLEQNSKGSGLNGQGKRMPNSRGLVLALELMELGIELARQRIVRENPNIPHDQLVAKVNEWLSVRRGETLVS